MPHQSNDPMTEGKEPDVSRSTIAAIVARLFLASTLGGIIGWQFCYYLVAAPAKDYSLKVAAEAKKIAETASRVNENCASFKNRAETCEYYLSAVISPDSPESRIGGVVVDANGRGVSGVRLTARNYAATAVVTDRDGHFELTVAAAAETRVRLHAKHPDFPPEDTSCYAGRDSCAIVLED